MTNKTRSSAILGAAFLMATSAVGPGFLTQTTVFTSQLLASFGFVILVSVILDIFAQLNIWRILSLTGKRAQDLANETLTGSGYVLAAMIVFGGLVFNIGNIAGTGLGLNAAAGLQVETGAAISALVAIVIFLLPDANRFMDHFVKVLGIVLLALIVYVLFVSGPPIGEAAFRTFVPTTIDARAIVTLVGGTVGGYITFAGAHRLIDAGITGKEHLGEINRSAVTGIVLTAIIRFCLFLAALGVISMGFTIDPANPPASVFQNAAGEIGHRLFGIVMWCAAITSVIGAAYTSISFLKTFGTWTEWRTRFAIVLFIGFSTAVFLAVGRPVAVLVWAGTINGFILPFGLALMLVAARRRPDIAIPTWLQAAGWLVVLIMAGFSVYTIVG
ncbi:MAG TPA: divalent metal cation transporter [Pyrinomonadaceae bacterium]|nr:divalent metal cation transporter [Pyrinomonadaceae bacterium]